MATLDLANCGALGFALQQALDEIREDDSLPYLSEDQSDIIKEALETAVANTNDADTDESDPSLFLSSSSRNANTCTGSPMLTATVDYYNRLGDKWRIVAESAELTFSVPYRTVSEGQCGKDISFQSDDRKRKNQKELKQIVKLQRLEILAYRDDSTLTE